MDGLNSYCQQAKIFTKRKTYKQICSTSYNRDFLNNSSSKDGVSFHQAVFNRGFVQLLIHFSPLDRVNITCLHCRMNYLHTHEYSSRVQVVVLELSYPRSDYSHQPKSLQKLYTTSVALEQRGQRQKYNFRESCCNFFCQQTISTMYDKNV